MALYSGSFFSEIYLEKCCIILTYFELSDTWRVWVSLEIDDHQSDGACATWVNTMATVHVCINITISDTTVTRWRIQLQGKDMNCSCCYISLCLLGCDLSSTVSTFPTAWNRHPNSMSVQKMTGSHANSWYISWSPFPSSSFNFHRPCDSLNDL